MIHSDKEVTQNAEENSEAEQPSSKEEVRLEEVEMTEAEEERVAERSVPAEVIENQSEMERGIKQKIRYLFHLIEKL